MTALRQVRAVLTPLLLFGCLLAACFIFWMVASYRLPEKDSGWVLYATLAVTLVGAYLLGVLSRRIANSNGPTVAFTFLLTLGIFLLMNQKMGRYPLPLDLTIAIGHGMSGFIGAIHHSILVRKAGAAPKDDTPYPGRANQ